MSLITIVRFHDPKFYQFLNDLFVQSLLLLLLQQQAVLIFLLSQSLYRESNKANKYLEK